jgi:hypothetical protein
VASIGFTKTAQQVYNELPQGVFDRYGAAILAIGADPYGQGRPFDVNDPYDRIMSLDDGWIRYSVRPLTEPEVLITDLSWYAL